MHARNEKHSAFERPFIAYDGEGYNRKYVLLADSTGRCIKNRDGLSTETCLEFLLEGRRDANNVWFGMSYDVQMLLHDLPLLGTFGSYEALYRNNYTEWRGYSIRYYPRKQFCVSKGEKGSSNYRSFNSYDVTDFFQTDFIEACQDWLRGVPEIISEGKAARNEFERWALSKIEAYNGEECRLLVKIMNRLRDAMRVAGLPVSRWDGGGAIAAAWLRREKADSYYAPWPKAMDDAVARALSAGRIDCAAFGRVTTNQFDIKSSYPANLRKVPDLTGITWKLLTTRTIPDEPFALCFVRWRVPDGTLWGPFFYRLPNGQIIWPLEGSGWYFACEVDAAARRFPRCIRIERVWTPFGNYTTPFTDSIERDYAKRKMFQAEGSPAEYVVKRGLNSIWGKLQQRQRDPWGVPVLRNYLWGGYVTAQTRAQINDAIRELGEDNVYAVLTDGILCRGELSSNSQLGGWESKDVSQATIVGAGLYTTQDSSGQPHDHKARGFTKAELNFDSVVSRWFNNLDFRAETYKLQRFVGMGRAIAHPQERENFLKFIEEERNLVCPLMFGTSKRVPSELIGREREYVFLPPRSRHPDEPSRPYGPAMLTHIARYNNDDDEFAE